MHDRALEELKNQGYTVLHGLYRSSIWSSFGPPWKGTHDEVGRPSPDRRAGLPARYNLVRRDALFRNALQQPEIVALAGAILARIASCTASSPGLPCQAAAQSDGQIAALPQHVCYRLSEARAHVGRWRRSEETEP